LPHILSRKGAVDDREIQGALDELIGAELPGTLLVSVSHRSTVEQFHGRHLELVGDGEWRLDRLTTTG
jgi:putative ATP-binding cassette transporter